MLQAAPLALCLMGSVAFIQIDQNARDIVVFNFFLRRPSPSRPPVWGSALLLMLVLMLTPSRLLATETTSPPTQAAPAAPAVPDAPSMADVEAAWARGDFVFVRQGLKHLAESGGDMLSQYRYGRVLLEGRGGPQDLMAARDWLERAAAQNQAAASVLLARLYLSAAPGGPARDPARAVVLLRPAAVRGNAEAQYYLGLLYSSGQGGDDRSG